jgi:hypothetical protein
MPPPFGAIGGVMQGESDNRDPPPQIVIEIPGGRPLFAADLAQLGVLLRATAGERSEIGPRACCT